MSQHRICVFWDTVLPVYPDKLLLGVGLTVGYPDAETRGDYNLHLFGDDGLLRARGERPNH